MLSVYAPVNFGGQPWILLAEIDQAEVLERHRPWAAILAGGIAGLLAMGFALLLWYLTRPRSVSPED